MAIAPLQMETRLVLTAYRKWPAPYPMVLSPTPYDLPFSHNTTRHGHPRSVNYMSFESQYATFY